MEKRKNFGRPEITAGDIVKYLMLAGIVVAAALLCICHASCQLTSQGIQALDAEESPQITGVSIVNASSIEVSFSKTVSVQNAVVSRLADGERASIDMAAQSPIKAKAVMSGDGKAAVYVFEKAADLGERYQLFSEIKDARGNSLTFALPFDGFNERLPRCVFVEVQPASYNGKKGVQPESPYVTIRALEDGNLFGMEMSSAANKKSWQLPKVEVKAGDEITLHLKPTKFPADCASELGNDLGLAKTGRSTSKRRDLFFDLDSKSIHSKNDVLFLVDRNAGKTIDALGYFTVEEHNETKWNLSQELLKAVEAGAWQGNASAESCFLMNDGKNKSSSTKPLVRKAVPTKEEKRPSSKYDWAVQSVY